MRKLLLIAVGGISIVISAYIWTATQHWYDTVPGVRITGPMNFHFAKDVGLAYLASGAALIWAGIKHDKSAGICGAAWLVLHALFHIGIWFHRGIPVDIISLTNLFGIQVPAFAAFFSAITMKSERA